MLLAIAERANIQGVVDVEAFRAEWRERWTRPGRRVRYMLGLNSMVTGCATRRRMERLLGVPSDAKVINLLWPDARPGTWDAAEAHEGAVELMRWFVANEQVAYDRIILFGRRVAAAFKIPAEAEWGTRFGGGEGDNMWAADENGPVLILPHPSGRSTVLNDASVAEGLRRRVAAFVAADLEGVTQR